MNVNIFKCNVKIYYHKFCMYFKIIWYVLWLLATGAYCGFNWWVVLDFDPFSGESIIFLAFVALVFMPFIKKIDAFGVNGEVNINVDKNEKYHTEKINKLLKEMKTHKKQSKTEIDKNFIIEIKQSINEIRQKEKGNG